MSTVIVGEQITTAISARVRSAATALGATQFEGFLVQLVNHNSRNSVASRMSKRKGTGIPF